MAKSNLDIIVVVRDAATGKLRNVEKELRTVGRAAQQSNVDFLQLNKTLFTLMATFGFVQKAFATFTSLVTKGAELGRVEDQFERVLGSKGVLIDQIKKFTDTAIDPFQAMQEGISLRLLGIVKDSGQVAELVGKAGTAAKLSGADAGEGIKQFSAFLKDGSISHLQFLNLLAQSNPALMAQMAILHKAGGVLGGVIAMQQRQAIGIQLLNAATRHHLKGEEDLLDVVNKLRYSFNLLKVDIGTFLGNALTPLIRIVSNTTDKFRSFFDQNIKGSQDLAFLTRGLVAASGALITFLGSMGSMSLFKKIAIDMLGFSPLGLSRLLFGLGSLFMGVTAGIDSFTERLKVFGGFFRGIFQLTSSFLTNPRLFAEGIGEMDKSLETMLKKHGLLDLVTNIARLTSVVSVFVKDVGNQLLTWGNNVEAVLSRVINSIMKLFGLGANNVWGRGLIDSGNAVRDMLVKLTAGIVGLAVLRKVLNFTTGGGGGMFGFGGKPDGSRARPLYVIPEGMMGMGGSLKDLLPTITGSLIGPIIGLVATAISSYGLGTILDRLSSQFAGQTNKYGQSFNPYEKAIAKLADMTGMSPGGMFDDTYGANSGSKYTSEFAENKRSDIVIPNMPDSEEDKLRALTDQMMSLDKSKQASFANSVSQAYEQASPGGGVITHDEWVEIFRQALDTSRNLNEINKKGVQTSVPRNSVSSRSAGF